MIYAVTVHNVFRVFPSGLIYILYSPCGLFFLVPLTGILFPRGLSRRVRKFAAIRKPDEAEIVFSSDIPCPIIYAVTVYYVFRVFPSCKPHKTQAEPIKVSLRCLFLKVHRNKTNFILIKI